MKTDSENVYSKMIQNFDPDIPRKRKSIADIKDKIEAMLMAGHTLKEIEDVVNYSKVGLSSSCVKTWGLDYRRILKKKGMK